MGFFTKKEKVIPSSFENKKEETIRTDGAFVSLISHQLRTPLTTIKWYAELLSDEEAGKLTDSQKKYIKLIVDNNQRVLDLIKVFSNLSKIEAGTVGVDLEQVNVISIIKNSLEKEVDLKKFLVEEDYHISPFILFADKNLLNLVFKNILSNAVKFSDENNKIKIQTQSVKKYFEVGGKKIDRDGFVVSFKDFGIGIPIEDHSKIFSKMFRCDNAKKAKVEGEGFGLFIAKSIIDLVGGEIWFESAEKQGSTFYIYLPELGMNKHEGSKRLE